MLWATRTISAFIERRDFALSVLTLAHTYECTIGFIAPILQGARIAYLDRPPSASALLPALKSVRPTIAPTVPLIMEKIYPLEGPSRAREDVPLQGAGIRRVLVFIAGKKLKHTFGGRLRFFGVGGAWLAPYSSNDFCARRAFPAIGYGLTETAPLVSGAPRASRRSTGPALYGVRVRIADPKPDTCEGEIQVRGPCVMRGYHLVPRRDGGRVHARRLVPHRRPGRHRYAGSHLCARAAEKHDPRRFGGEHLSRRDRSGHQYLPLRG